ncbi:hypothetical protein DSO57_1039826 [Entomophthora muscae]|uniref:Uncharacterized protein n=1 Tax=Entomophthora muscae TaxID=34485 RepID=A0ACC2TEM8_9FUNG|nr:hypothetical protein DSO57_1039826 [Entomophthora muscae]
MLTYNFEPYAENEKLSFECFLFASQNDNAIPDLLSKIQSCPFPVVAIRADMINDAFRLFGIKEYSGPVLLISLETCSQKLSELRSYLESTFGTKSLEFF